MVQKSLIAVLIISFLLTLTVLANSAWRLESKATDTQLASESYSCQQNVSNHEPPTPPPPPHDDQHPWGEGDQTLAKEEHDHGFFETGMDLIFILYITGMVF